mgnify:CR=1 FL=1
MLKILVLKNFPGGRISKSITLKAIGIHCSIVQAKFRIPKKVRTFRVTPEVYTSIISPNILYLASALARGKLPNRSFQKQSFSCYKTQCDKKCEINI